MFLKLSAVGPMGSEDDSALQRDHDLRLGGGVEFRQVQGLYLLLIEEDDVDSFFELVDDAGLQILVEGHERLAVTAPGGMHIDDQQLGILVRVVGEEVLCVSDGGRQLQFLALRSHACPNLSYNNSKNHHPSFIMAGLGSHWQLILSWWLGYYQMSNIKYLGFAKASSALPVFGSALDKSLEEFLKGEVPKVIVKLKELQLKKEQRQRIKSEFGVWFCKKDQHEIYYLALCAHNYPERHIYAAISQLQTHLAQLGDYEHEADSVLKLHAKEKVIELAQKYDNLKSMDKIGEANRLLDGIKEDIADSTLKLMNNTVNLDGLERKASDLKENAFMFEKSAHEVQREMWWRNCKMKILIGIVVVALICVIVIPIATTVGKH